MKLNKLASILFLTLFAAASIALGQSTILTDPVGFVSGTCPTGSDTYIAAPLTRAPEFVGTVASVSGTTITVSGSAVLTTNQFVYTSGTQPNHYYVLIGPNPVALAGTVSTTQGSKTITGTGTAFSTAVHVGDVLILNGISYYKVTGVTSDTSLTVLAAASTTASGITAGVSAAGTNPKEGCYYQIVSNTPTSLTVTLPLVGDSITSLSAGTQVSVIPFWTLGTLFPSTSSGTAFTATTALRSIKTQILLPDYNSVGINKAAASIYFFYSGNWRYTQDPNELTTVYDDTVLIPGGYFIVRNPAGTASSVFTVQGNVTNKQVTLPLYTETNVQQDNPIAVLRPVDTPLNQMGLIESGAFVPTTALRTIKDQLLVYSGTTTGINRAADKVYFYYNNDWRLTTDTTGSHGSDLIPVGNGFIIRKATTTSGSTTLWMNTPTFN